MRKMFLLRFSILKKALNYIPSKIWLFAILALLSVFELFIVYLYPLYYGFFINNIIAEKNITNLKYIIFIYIFTVLCQILITYLKLLSENTLLIACKVEIKRVLLGNIFNKSDNAEISIVGDYVIRLEKDIDCMDVLFNQQTIEYIISFISIVLSFLLMIKISVPLQIYSLVIIPVTLLLERFAGIKKGNLRERMIKTNEIIINWLYDTIKGWKTIKAYNAQQFFLKRYMELSEKYNYYHVKFMNIWVITNHIIPRIKDDLLSTVLIYFLGGILIVRNKISIADLLVYISYFSILTKSINNLAATDSDLLDKIPSFNRIFNKEENVLKKKDILDNKIKSIKVQNIWYRYNENQKWLFCSYHLTINKGDIVGIYGRSGIGKTTLIKLLCGILYPQIGTIKINDVNIKDLSENYIYDHIGIVLKESELFNGTIEENLLVGSDLKIADVMEICNNLNITDFVNSFPNKFNTIIGDNGMKISGGQKQRILIARQLIRSVDCLMLDEATNAIEEAEALKIMKNIIDCSSIDILIVITHRPSIMKYCTKVVKIMETS